MAFTDYLQQLQTGLLGAPDNYGGLLDKSAVQAAQQRGRMALAASLLQASGPSTQRIGTGQAIGNAIMAGQQAQDAQTQDSIRAQIMKQQLLAKQVEKPVAVIDPVTGKPTLVKESQSYGMQPYNNTAEAKPAASIQEYNQYVADMKAAHQTPKPFLEFAKDYAVARTQYPFGEATVGGVPTLYNRTWGAGPPAATPPLGPTPPQVAPPLAPPSIAPSVAPTAPRTQPLSTLQNEANAKRTLAGAEAGGRTTGEKVAGAEFDLPRVTDTVNQALVDINQLRSHPGLQYITGMYSKAPVIPGTSQASAQALAQQVQGQTFLQAYQQLRGGGAITDTEGQKATQAIARLNQSQSTEDYQKGLDELAGILRTGLERAQGQAGKAPAVQKPRSREDILRQYGVGP